MIYILAIETTTKNCSVSILANQEILASKDLCSDNYSHAEKLTLFISEVLQTIDISINDLSAVAVSKGPGSYTGLRIGVAVAKGLCYSLDIPLIAVSTLKAMAYGLSIDEEFELFCPMIDARRMEVFSAIYNKENQEIRGVQADIVDDSTYKYYLSKKVLFFGDGAIKCRSVINNSHAFFKEDIYPSSKYIGVLAFNKYKNKIFEDIAYFEPYYLKDFVVGKKN